MSNTPSIYDDQFAKAIAKAQALATVTATADTAAAILQKISLEFNCGMKGFDPNVPGLVEEAGGRLGNLAAALQRVTDQVIQLHYELSKLYMK